MTEEKKPVSLYDAIQNAWDDYAKVLGDTHPATVPPHVQPLESRARQLDQRYADAIEPYLSQYADGLISSTELFGFMYREASKPVEE